MAEKKSFNYFVLSDEFEPLFRNLPTEECGVLLKAIVKKMFADRDYEPVFENPVIKAIYIYLIAQVEELTILSRGDGLKGGFYIERRRKESGYQKFRQIVLERDGYKCRICGATENLHVHHIKPYSEYEDGRTDPDNGITLCAKCHRKVHSKHGDL